MGSRGLGERYGIGGGGGGNGGGVTGADVEATAVPGLDAALLLATH